MPRADNKAAPRAPEERNMDPELARRICRLIAGIVVSDEDLAPKEEEFVDRMLERFGIPAAEREVIFPIIDASEAAETISTLSTEQQSEAFGLLIQAAAADGSIAPEELTYLEKVADALQVTRDELSDRLSEALRAAHGK